MYFPFIFPETPTTSIDVHCIYYCIPPVLMFGRARTAPAIRTPVTRQPLQLVRVSMSAISASVVHYGVVCSSFCSNHTVCTMLTAQLTMASVMMTRNYHHYQHQIINNPYTVHRLWSNFICPLIHNLDNKNISRFWFRF